MVCLGNICRSPLAEGILRKQLEDAQLSERFFVDSAAVAAYHTGDSPDKRSIAVARNHNIDISHLKARQIKASDLDNFDYIFVMDRHNYQDVLSLSHTEAHRKKIHFLRDALEYSHHKPVPDPYYGDMSDFENVFHLIDEACVGIVKHLKNL